MTTNGAPEKLWWSEGAVWHTNPNSIRYVEYVRKDAFVEKAKKWFEKQNEWRDINGIKYCDMESFENFIQYASREIGIKAHAEDYSFNIESELFQQLNKEQQELWRKEIEQACMSGGYCGLNLGLDKRYDKEEPVSNDFEMALAEMVDNAQKCVVEPWVVAAQWKDYLIKLAKSEEPVSEELEKAAIEAFKQIVDSDKNNFLEIFKAGAKWQKTKDESITEDLGEYINELSKQFPEVSFAKLSRIAVRVAKWHREQMMAKVIDATCFALQGAALFTFRLPAGSYLVGSKVKVIIIKED